VCKWAVLARSKGKVKAAAATGKENIQFGLTAAEGLLPRPRLHLAAPAQHPSLEKLQLKYFQRMRMFELKLCNFPCFISFRFT